MAVSLFFDLEEYCLIEQKQVVQFSLKDREKMTPRATTIKTFKNAITEVNKLASFNCHAPLAWSNILRKNERAYVELFMLLHAKITDAG
jgi:hypothetical protein